MIWCRKPWFRSQLQALSSLPVRDVSRVYRCVVCRGWHVKETNRD